MKRNLKVGRPRLDPSLKLVKKAVFLPPSLLSDLDYVADFSRSSRSAVISVLLADPLHDLVSSIENSILDTRADPTGAVHLECHAKEFLQRLHSGQDLGLDDLLVYMPLRALGEKHD